MFKINERYQVDRKTLKCDYIKKSLAEVSTNNSPKSQIFINIPREDSVISLLNSYLELIFEVVKKTDKGRFGNGNDIRSVNLGPIALFSVFILTTSSGKHLEDISHTRIISSLYKLITSAKDFDDMSIGFDHSRSN